MFHFFALPIAQNPKFYLCTLVLCSISIVSITHIGCSRTRASLELFGDVTPADKEILADYDNAIRYNDKVVHEIVNTFDRKNAIILYVPDHGEMVYDESNEFGRNLKLGKKYVVPQYDIPFWIYCTDTYQATHPHICQQIKQSANRPFMTDDLPHLLTYLAGIKSKDYRAERNLIDDAFNVRRKRIICGKIDYDELIAE